MVIECYYMKTFSLHVCREKCSIVYMYEILFSVLPNPFSAKTVQRLKTDIRRKKLSLSATDVGCGCLQNDKHSSKRKLNFFTLLIDVTSLLYWDVDLKSQNKLVSLSLQTLLVLQFNFCLLFVLLF